MKLDTKHCAICGEESKNLICDRIDCYMDMKYLMRLSPALDKITELVNSQLAGIRKEIPPKMLLDNAISLETRKDSKHTRRGKKEAPIAS